MKKLRLEIGKLLIGFDRDYGCEKRTGWSIAWDGHFLCSHIEPSFFGALIIAAKTHFAESRAPLIRRYFPPGEYPTGHKTAFAILEKKP